VRTVREQPRLADAGATVAALAMGGGHAVVGWSGDCRVYRLRGRKLAQLTVDHAPDEATVKEHLSNLESTLVRAGVAPRERSLYLTLAEARCSAVVMKCLGATEHLDADVHTIDARAGDAFLVCTDGFMDHDTRELKLGDATVAAALREAEDPARALVDAVLALEDSAQDNLAAVVVRL
jgi:serine/threonine protein phosphatase PrpC